jgi:hypothetical protein
VIFKPEGLGDITLSKFDNYGYLLRLQGIIVLLYMYALGSKTEITRYYFDVQLLAK